jgi:peptide deformylase
MNMSSIDTAPTSSKGKVHPITRWSTPILHRKCQSVTTSQYNTPELDTLVTDMFATMYASTGGVGLAANQIGVDMSVFVYDIEHPVGVQNRGVVCNPVIEVGIKVNPDQETKVRTTTEGCLSFPGISAKVTRPHSVVVRGNDEKGTLVEIKAEGQLAMVMQHEVDHLNGVVYGDHVSREDRDRMDKRYAQLVAEDRYPMDWPVSLAKGKWEF